MPNSGFLFIPVDTGNTCDKWVQNNRFAVHPRGYGEHGTDLATWIADNGSSPWIRGTRTAMSNIDNVRRFIPVDTGNTTILFAK